MPASEEINARITRVLVQALGVEEDDITPSATLQGNLGAESIDFLDIVFRLEREFVIKIRQGELFARPVFQGDTDIVQDGRVTDEGLAALRPNCRTPTCETSSATAGWTVSRTCSPSACCRALSRGSSTRAAEPTATPRRRSSSLGPDPPMTGI